MKLVFKKKSKSKFQVECWSLYIVSSRFYVPKLYINDIQNNYLLTLKDPESSQKECDAL